MALTPLTENGAHRSGSGCLDAELLASYVDGRTTRAERAEVEAHLAQCEHCYFAFSETLQEQRTHQSTDSKNSDTLRQWRVWIPRAAAGLAAAAALVMVVQVFRPFIRADDHSKDALNIALNELGAAAGPYRRFEPRLTIANSYRPLQLSTRSGASSPIELPFEVREAAIKVEQAAAASTGVERQRALAAMYLAQGRAEPAANELTPLALAANDAGLLNDIAATLIARGNQGDAKQALDLLERAVASDPNRVEAWFNLGLAAEATGLVTRAEAAWSRYLALDSSSLWALEALDHLERLKRRRQGIR
jgi:tetratricopeptide (TPR) repeat protein